MVRALAYYEELIDKVKNTFEKIDNREKLEEFNKVICECITKIRKFETNFKIYETRWIKNDGTAISRRIKSNNKEI